MHFLVAAIMMSWHTLVEITLQSIVNYLVRNVWMELDIMFSLVAVTHTQSEYRYRSSVSIPAGPWPPHSCQVMPGMPIQPRRPRRTAMYQRRRRRGITVRKSWSSWHSLKLKEASSTHKTALKCPHASRRGCQSWMLWSPNSTRVLQELQFRMRLGLSSKHSLQLTMMIISGNQAAPLAPFRRVKELASLDPLVLGEFKCDLFLCLMETHRAYHVFQGCLLNSKLTAKNWGVLKKRSWTPTRRV